MALPKVSLSQSLQLSSYNIDHGLSRGIIKSAITDAQGFLWSATDEGIIRYDGQNSIFYGSLIPKGFAKGFFNTRAGKLLVYHDFGVDEIICQADTSYTKSIIPKNELESGKRIIYPKSIYEDQNGGLWISELQSIIYVKEDKFKKYEFGIEDLSESLLNSFAICEDDKGNLWAMSNTGSLYFFDKKQDQFIRKSTSDIFTNVSFMLFIQSSLLIGDQNGISQIFPDSSATNLSSRQITSLEEVTSGALINQNQMFIGTKNKGLYILSSPFAEGGLKKLDLIASEEILSIWNDKNGLWLTSADAINLIYESSFGQIELTDGSDFIHSLHWTNQNQIILTSGINILELAQKESNWQVVNVIKPPQRTSIVEALREGNYIWMGGFDGSIHGYKRDEGAYTKVPAIKAGHEITQLFKDSQGNLWACGNDTEGLLRLKDGKVMDRYKAGSLKQSEVIKEIEGNIYCVTKDNDSFLYQYNSSTNQFKDISGKLPFEIENQLIIYDFIGIDKALLLATNQGLIKQDLASKQVERLDLEKVPIDQSVLAITQDAKGIIWLSTYKGLVEFKDDNVVLYDHSNGLPTRTLTPRTLLLDTDRLWLGTIKGLVFHQKNYQNYANTPKPLVKEIRFNNQLVSLKEVNAIYPYQSVLEAKFYTLSFPSDQIKYQYRILGKDSTWSNPTANYHIVIPTLPTGTYTFQIRAQQIGKPWSSPLEFKFTIDQPWYLKWWSIISVLLLVCLILFASVQIYGWNLRKKNRQLEKIVSKRTQEIKLQQQQIIDQKNQIIYQQGEIIQKNKAISEVELRNKELQEKQLKQDLEERAKKLTTITLRINQKNETLLDIKNKLSQISKSLPNKESSELDRLVKDIDFSFKLEKDWDEFAIYFEQVYVGFYKNLKQKHPQLNSSDLRHCALIRLNLTINESANLLRVSTGSIKTFRFRLRKKMGLENQEELMNEVMSL